MPKPLQLNPWRPILKFKSPSKKKPLKVEVNTYLSVDDQDESVIGQNKIGDYRSFVNLVNYAKEFRSSFVWGFLFILLSSIVVILSARMMGEMVEKGLSLGLKEQAFFYAGLVLFFEALSLLFQWSGRKILTEGSSKTIFLIRQKLFHHLQMLPISYYDRQPQGRIVTRITHDVEGIEEFFSASLGRLINAFFSAAIALMAMLLTDLKLGSILVLTAIPCFIFIYVTKDRIRTVNRGMSKYSSALNAKLSEFINGLEVIRSYGLEKWSKKHFDDAVERHHQNQLKANMLFAFVQPLSSFLVALPLIGLVAFGGPQVINGTLSIGLFVAFVRYCERFFMPIMMLAREVHVIQQAFTSAERVASFLKEADEDQIFGKQEKAQTSELKGELVFDHVWMAYNDEDWVLKDIHFHIKSGEKIGLVGATGCGKTTTVSLLSRLYDYQKGEILLDGHSLRLYDREYLRSKIGFVSQDVIIIKGTLRENLTTDESLTDDFLLAACEKTGLAKVMESGRLTLDTEIYESGANLSSGERQLLALTRVLLRSPALLILDEATANIDPHYEKLIQQAVEKLMRNKTCLVIAHRLETIMSCDRLFVFEAGRLVEVGPPQELLANKGIFYQLQKANTVQEAHENSKA